MIIPELSYQDMVRLSFFGNPQDLDKSRKNVGNSVGSLFGTSRSKHGSSIRINAKSSRESLNQTSRETSFINLYKSKDVLNKLEEDEMRFDYKSNESVDSIDSYPSPIEKIGKFLPFVTNIDESVVKPSPQKNGGTLI